MAMERMLISILDADEENPPPLFVDNAASGAVSTMDEGKCLAIGHRRRSGVAISQHRCGQFAKTERAKEERRK
jgi:hypothetical protein